MGTFVNSLVGTSGINAGTIGDDVSLLIPAMIVFFGVGLTWYLVRKMLRGGSKLKFRI